MRNTTTLSWLGGIVAIAAACGPAGSPATTIPGPDPATPSPSVLERAERADSVRKSYTPADVDFMRGMIHHHAQALVMARMATSRGASPELQTLAVRIVNGQKDEIALMQQWLRDRDEPVPHVDEAGRIAMAGHESRHGANADEHAVHVAGMLTPDQLERLDAARGSEWDRLFLTFMIQHHQGALQMVEELFATRGAAQGDAMFKIASGIGADQAGEIDRMQRMLQDLLFGPDSV